MKAIQNQNIIIDGSGSYDIDDDDLRVILDIIQRIVHLPWRILLEIQSLLNWHFLNFDFY